MNFKEALNKLIKDNKKSHASLAELIGRKNPTFISNMVSRGNCNVDTLLEITDAWLNEEFEGGRHEARIAKIPVK